MQFKFCILQFAIFLNIEIFIYHSILSVGYWKLISIIFFHFSSLFALNTNFSYFLLDEKVLQRINARWYWILIALRKQKIFRFSDTERMNLCFFINSFSRSIKLLRSLLKYKNSLQRHSWKTELCKNSMYFKIHTHLDPAILLGLRSFPFTKESGSFQK